MANYFIKFIDNFNPNDCISVVQSKGLIIITSSYNNRVSTIELDKSTAIKFAKTLRTEINKITESEVNNG